MRSKYLLTFFFVVCIALIPFLPSSVSGQGNLVSRIREAIDNSKLATLRGNVHPLARSEFDRGAAASSLPMEHMQLVLNRSADQQTALETLLAQQQDSTSPNYHKWLTPDEFGQQFGAADQDIQKITSWLQSQGFAVNEVAKGHGTIDFSGNAGQVQQAFHTSMHRYVMANGAERWANASDPQIPSALATVVAGVHSLNSFPRRRMSRAIKAQYTFGGNCNGTNTNCYGIGPADFATIYNSQALLNSGINGSGQTIAVVGDSDINTADVNSFRSIFGLPAITLQKIVPPGTTNPGVQNSSSGNGDEIESVLDVEWAGAVAPNATIDLVISNSPTTSGSTTFSFGGDYSANYIVNSNIAPILSYSYGQCELFLGTTGNAFYQNLWSQAATEGITVIVSTGDNGSGGCDDPTQNLPVDFGLAVNGVGSTPYNIAIGGTDFNDLTNPATYFNNSNTAGTLNSAKVYIPEVAYNDSCVNSLIYASNGVFGFASFSTAEAACNNATVQSKQFLEPAGGSGGVSNCTTSNGNTVSSCSGGYAKPTWQTGPGVPSDGKRDVPDVSLFAGDGVIQNFYIFCESDQNNGAACTAASGLSGVGGTSVSAQAFAGIAALIDQKTGSRQGNFNPLLYTLAAEQAGTNCNSTGSPSSACVFYDTTVGTIAMPCDNGFEPSNPSLSPNCVVNTSGDKVGVLSGYNAGTGFDLATGLGSVNINNLVTKFGPNFYLKSSSSNLSVAAGSPGTATVTATSVQGFTGAVTLSCSGLPSGTSCNFSTNPVNLTANGSATTNLTISKSTSFLAPFDNERGPGGFPISLILLTGVIGALFLTRRRSMAFAVVTFSVFLICVGCGGGSSSSSTSSNSSSTSTSSTTTATVMATGGSISYPLSISVTVQ